MRFINRERQLAGLEKELHLRAGENNNILLYDIAGEGTPAG